MSGHFYAVIMAGGGGTRLWPLSRQAKPKQSLSIFGDRTLFQIAVDRLGGLFTSQEVFVVTIASQAEQLHLQCPEIPTGTFLAAEAIQKKDPQGVMVVLTADHYIQNVVEFQKVLHIANEVAQKRYLVTLGVPPLNASTGYGYLERGTQIDQFGGRNVYAVKAFKEKPDQKTARAFLDKGNYYWNSGMFIWKVDVILDQFRLLMPDLSFKVSQLRDEIGHDHTSPHFREVWESIIPETIDYGIMEKSDCCVILPADDLRWNDVGSWDSIFEVVPPDDRGNILINVRHIGFDTNNSLICSTNPDRLVVTIGLDNMIIVDSGDALLICPRGESQKVKDLVKYLKENHLTPFL
jgi:mannose-1-phosphate guanylyltransferase